MAKKPMMKGQKQALPPQMMNQQSAPPQMKKGGKPMSGKKK